MTINEINERMAAIRTEMDAEGADLDALMAEAEDLSAQRDAAIAALNKRANILDKVARGAGVELPKAGETPAPVDKYATAEYRSAWLAKLQGGVNQRAAIALTDVDEAMPTITVNKIIDEIKTIAPLLGEITVLNVNGGVRFAVESGRTAAGKHTENGTITPSGVTLTEVALSAYEICKLIQISESVKTMTIDSFESWLVANLAKALAENINAQPVYGDGSNQGTGIEDEITWTDGTNQVTVAATGSLTAADVLAACGMLPAAYDAKAKWVMSKRTLFTAFLGLQDKAKNSLVINQGNTYYIMGYPVLLSDNVPLNDAYLGDWSTIYANMPLNATVKSQFDINTNSYKYLGTAMFDCKPTKADAFVKVTKATS